MITFRMRLRPDDQYEPAHPEAEGLALIWNDPARTYEELRAHLLSLVEEHMPGVYTLEWNVDELRALRLAEVTERTRVLLREGFAYGAGGLHFPCDSAAQAYYNLLRIQAAPLLGLTLSYPIVVPTVDDASDVALGNPATLGPFLAAAAAHVRAIRDGDANLKRALRTAQTVAAVQAVVDAR